MKIKLYVIGKIKEPYLRSGIEEYLTRLTPYVKLEIVEVKDESIRELSIETNIRNANIAIVHAAAEN